ncbi:MAG: hypothetical protein FD167_4697, partial [bacterium]
MLLPKTTIYNIRPTSSSVLLFIAICLGVSLFVIDPIQANQANQASPNTFDLAQQTK